MHPARPPHLLTLLVCLGMAPAVLAQTSTPPDAPAAGAASTSQPAGKAAPAAKLQDEEDLYILKDVPEPASSETTLDLGKVGKKGELSLERMPLESDGDYDQRRKGAAGVRLKFPIGKQGR